MSFLTREFNRLNCALLQGHNDDVTKRLYAAQQAVSWALDPQGFKSALRPYYGHSGRLRRLSGVS